MLENYGLSKIEDGEKKHNYGNTQYTNLLDLKDENIIGVRKLDILGTKKEEVPLNTEELVAAKLALSVFIERLNEKVDVINNIEVKKDPEAKIFSTTFFTTHHDGPEDKR
jgi:hypothetical protein